MIYQVFFFCMNLQYKICSFWLLSHLMQIISAIMKFRTGYSRFFTVYKIGCSFQMQFCALYILYILKLDLFQTLVRYTGKIQAPPIPKKIMSTLVPKTLINKQCCVKLRNPTSCTLTYPASFQYIAYCGPQREDRLLLRSCLYVSGSVYLQLSPNLLANGWLILVSHNSLFLY